MLYTVNFLISIHHLLNGPFESFFFPVHHICLSALLTPTYVLYPLLFLDFIFLSTYFFIPPHSHFFRIQYSDPHHQFLHLFSSTSSYPSQRLGQCPNLTGMPWQEESTDCKPFVLAQRWRLSQYITQLPKCTPDHLICLYISYPGEGYVSIYISKYAYTFMVSSFLLDDHLFDYSIIVEHCFLLFIFILNHI